MQTAAREEIRDRLELTQQGKPANTAMNYKTVFQNDPLLKGAIRKNLLTERTDIVKPLGWYRESSTLTDVDEQCCQRLEVFQQSETLPEAVSSSERLGA